MNLVKQISAKVVAVLILLMLVNFTPSIAQDNQKTNLASQTFPIVDTLRGVSTSTVFDIGGTGGQVIYAPISQIGPEFTLTQRTVITEIGGFIDGFLVADGCGSSCPPTLPMIVEIRPSNNGVPDLSTVIASFVMSEDFNPFAVSYSSANLNLTLNPGTYFALFVSQGNNGGFLLTSARFPFEFNPDTVRLGVIDRSTGRSLITTVPAAVRVLGKVTFDKCIQDDSSQNTISLSTETGDYQFTNCQGLIISGTGRITNRGCTTVLEDVRADRRVSVRIDSCALKATASVQLLSQGRIFTIMDRNTSNNSCTCQ